MPIYEYQCGACGHQLEAFQKMSEAPLLECPECKSAALQKLVSASGFQLKGTGWYVTDFRDKGKGDTTKTNQAQNSEKSSTDSSSSSSSTSTDSGTKADKT